MTSWFLAFFAAPCALMLFALGVEKLVARLAGDE